MRLANFCILSVLFIGLTSVLEFLQSLFLISVRTTVAQSQRSCSTLNLWVPLTAFRLFGLFKDKAVFLRFRPDIKKNRYAMRTCVCYLEIQQSLRKEGNARFANQGHLRFVSVTFGFHCGRWKARYVSELFSFS